MDYKAWRSSKAAHRHFVKEEKEDYYGKPRKAKIFVDAMDDEEILDPKDNIFYMDEEEKKEDQDAAGWLNRDSINGLMQHNMRIMSGKAGVKKGKKLNSTQLNDDEEPFDPFNPQANLKLGGGPIPYSKDRKLKRRKVVVEEHGPAIEESMATWATEGEEKEETLGDYDDGVVRPKKIKELSDKRKRAALLKGNPNPASKMREELQYKAALEGYKRAKGVETEDNVDTSALANYGAVEVRRKKVDGDEDEFGMDEDAALALQEQLDREREERLREIAEKELFQKEQQLVIRRLGNFELDRRKGLAGRIGDMAKQQFKFIRGQFEEPTKIMPFLWLGNSATAHNKKLLVDLGITHVLNTAKDVDNAFPELFVYSKIGMDDSEDQEMDGVFEHAFKFINRVRACGGRLLVHCTAGVSRAATIVLGYIVSEESQLLVDAYSYVRFLRPPVGPNEGFLYHLALLEMKTHRVTSVAFHKAWKFYSYTQLKSGADPAWDDGPVDRKQGVGLFVMAVFRKLGVPKKRSLISRFLDAVFSTYEGAKVNQRMAAERIAKAKVNQRMAAERIAKAKVNQRMA
eukprot:CAMPEP_0118642734 /NCGR_PEP_ID=MMETSP0785-20121206/5992_1 /TAXON_ID=91992 /ORGANISM="Bolidomonas pacifica, Strain CCMP 1866" /LENGTH=571 /DNA_ID=CAMNT_0006534303 /DNA_START=137 /DNA_END=1849 /DNA_ORIENTATION=-